MTRCPYCGREIRVSGSRFMLHNVENVPRNGTVCPTSNQRIPITGTSNTDHANRADVLADLACQVQDQDPHIVWQYLTCLPAGELQRLLMFALAALPVDRTLDEMWGWVKDLPISRLKEAV